MNRLSVVQLFYEDHGTTDVLTFTLLFRPFQTALCFYPFVWRENESNKYWMNGTFCLFMLTAPRHLIKVNAIYIDVNKLSDSLLNWQFNTELWKHINLKVDFINCKLIREILILIILIKHASFNYFLSKGLNSRQHWPFF